MTLWCVEVGPMANAKEGSLQEQDWARVVDDDDADNDKETKKVHLSFAMAH